MTFIILSSFPSAVNLRRKREQSQMSSSFDGGGQLPLVKGAVAGDTPGEYLGPVA
jgi:hypothetical protein